MKKKLVSVLLVAAMTLSMTACGNSSSGDDTQSGSDVSGSDSEEAFDQAAYDAESAEIYDAELGEFYEAYQTALAETNVSTRYALMAVAEAKLMESAVMLPSSSNGGRYAMSRVAPYSVAYSLWGTDQYRYHDALVTTEFISVADRDVMKAQWAELRGTGEYHDWAKEYLTQQGYTLKDTYTLGYTSDPTTWDVLSSSQTVDSEPLVNTYDGLMEYDGESQLQPALAESYEISEDGLTYTFHIRQGVKWVNSQGAELADVTANDFVTGMQHMIDAGGPSYIVEGIVSGVSEYVAGEITDFSEVGVKATDDYTLVYTLDAPCTYFLTMLGYSTFAPLNEAYYTSMGGKFGAEYDPSAADYQYGKDQNSIAYCGPYLVTAATATNSIQFVANESYWNADNIEIKQITWLYNDGSDPTKAYTDAVAGTIDAAGLTSSTIPVAQQDGLFDTYAYVSLTDATSFCSFYNMNRNIFANFNDDTKVVSTQTEEDAARAKAALNNVHFRRAVSFALDRIAYNAQVVGEDVKTFSVVNSYTPGNFVSLEEDVTISINGTDTTFAAGTYYGAIVQAQIDADGVKITVWDPEAEEGAGSSAGFDGWYNVENAVEELNAAIDELAEEGVTIDAENPIVLDLPYASSITAYADRATAYKQSVEAALDGLVVINLVAGADANEWYYAGYFGEYGYENNYNIYDCSGWGPDYGDPATYLGTFDKEYAGYMTKSLGIY